MAKTIIHTDRAPAAIGAYSQAVRAGDTVYLSGQIPLDPATMQLVDGVEAQILPGLGHGMMMESDWRVAADPILAWLKSLDL